MTPTAAEPAVGLPARVELAFEPSGTRVRVPGGVTVFDAASWNGIAIDSTCGGHGTCKKCKIKITGGTAPVSPLDVRAFSPDELNAGWRLACRAPATEDLQVEVPPLVTRPKAATVGVGRQVILRPAAQKRYLELAEPTLSDQRTDLERVLGAVDDLELKVDLAVLRSIGTVLRAADYDAIVSSGKMLARKFDPATDGSILDRLDMARATLRPA